MADGTPGHASLREALILETAANLQREITVGKHSGYWLSRATWFRDTDIFDNAVVAPVVGGQTVWEGSAKSHSRITIVEQPNYFGRRENRPPGGSHVRTIEWWPGPKGLGPADPAADGPHGDLEAARHLATGLRSISGVRLPHGTPDAPWFVASLPVSAAAAAAALHTAGYTGCRALGAQFPEFPGGLHLQVAWPRRDNGAVLAAVRGVIEDLERK